MHEILSVLPESILQSTYGSSRGHRAFLANSGELNFGKIFLLNIETLWREGSFFPSVGSAMVTVYWMFCNGR